VLAEGSGAVWTMQIQGRRQNGEAFTSSMFIFSWHGRTRRPSPARVPRANPTGVAAVPIEILEAVMPIIFDRKELRPGSGGRGASPGGDARSSSSI